MFEGLFQPMHVLLIAAIALLVFGPKKLPELGLESARESGASSPQCKNTTGRPRSEAHRIPSRSNHPKSVCGRALACATRAQALWPVGCTS